MASKFCTLIHPSKNKRHQARVAEGQISSIKQQAAKQLEQTTQLKNLTLEQIDTACQQMQQEINDMYQAAVNSAAADLVTAQNLHQEALVRLSCLWIYGKASIHAKHVQQDAALLQSHDLELQNLPKNSFYFLFGPSAQYIEQQQQIHLKHDQAISNLASQKEQLLADFTGNYRGAVAEETQKFAAFASEHDKLLQTIAADKLNKEVELNQFINSQQQILEKQYQADIQAISNSMHKITNDINRNLQQHFKALDSQRKSMALNGGLIICSAFVSWAVPQLLAGAIGSFAASTVQVSAGLTALGATSNLVNGNGTVGFNVTLSVPNNNTRPYTPPTPYKPSVQAPALQEEVKLPNNYGTGINLSPVRSEALHTGTQRNIYSESVSSSSRANSPAPKANIGPAKIESGAKNPSNVSRFMPQQATKNPNPPIQPIGIINWSHMAWRALANDKSTAVTNWQQHNRNNFPRLAAFLQSIANSKPQRIVNVFADQFAGRPIRFVGTEAQRIKHGEPTQTAQFVINTAKTLKDAQEFIAHDTQRFIAGEATETGFFFKRIGNFVAEDFTRLRHDDPTIIGTAIVTDFKALANMTPEELAAHLGHEAGDAFIFFVAGGGLQAGSRAATKIMDTAVHVSREFVAKHSFHPPLTFQFQAGKLYNGFPIDAVKVQKPIKRKGNKKPVIGEAYESKQAPTSLGHSRTELKNYLKNITSVPREQLVRDLNSIGFKYIGGSGDGKYCKFTHPQRGFNIRIDDVHPPKRNNGCKYQHIHLFDKQGNSLNADFKIVSPSSPDAHIKISEWIKQLELKL